MRGKNYYAMFTLLIVAVVILSTIVIISLYVFRSHIATTPNTATISSTYNQSNTSILVRNFLASARKYYLRYMEGSYLDDFCKALILNSSIVNTTFILIHGRPYLYGVLAYMPPTGNYQFIEQLKLNNITVTHILPQENITVTGGFGPLQWFRVSKNNVTKTLYFASYPGIVYNNGTICGSITIELEGEHIFIAKIFIVESTPKLVETSLWLVLLPVNITKQT